MNKRVIAITSGLFAAASTLFAVPAQAATPTLSFSYIRYDSPGSDTRSNKSLNAEYVRITNFGLANNLRNWTLKDAAGHTYRFPDHPMGKNKTVYVHTGKGTDGTNPATGKRDSAHLFWGSGNYVWNNPGDTATLRSSSGRIYDKCVWKKIGSGHTSC
jgi:hypothetical protein